MTDPEPDTKALIREYHEAIKDLRTEIKRAQGMLATRNIREQIESIILETLDAESFIAKLSAIIREKMEIEIVETANTDPLQVPDKNFSPIPIEGNEAAKSISEFANKVVRIITRLPEANGRQFILYVRDDKKTPALNRRDADSQKVAVRVIVNDANELRSAKAELIHAINGAIKEWK